MECGTVQLHDVNSVWMYMIHVCKWEIANVIDVGPKIKQKRVLWKCVM